MTNQTRDIGAEQSTTPWRCEVAWHAHTDDQRGPTCRPDSALHPQEEDSVPAAQARPARPHSHDDGGPA